MRLVCVLVLFAACDREALDVTRHACADGCDLALPADGGTGDDLANLSGVDLAGVTLLDGLSLSDATLSFSPIVSDYSARVGVLLTSLTVTATAAAPRTITINGAPAVSGVPAPFTLANGANTITVEVDGPFGPRSYHVVVTRGAADYFKGTGSTAFGNNLALSATTLAVANDNKQLFIFHRAADGSWSQEALLDGFNSNVEGVAVDESGDFVFANDLPASGGEVIHIYTRSDGTWTQAGVLKSPDSYATNFGVAIAISGDTLAVGANAEASDTTGINPAHDNAGIGSGAVYVYRGAGAGWSMEAFLKASNAGVFDQFGNSLVLEGDTLAVSAPDEASNSTGINSTPNDNVSGAGAVYVFGRSGTTWSQQAYVKPSRPLVANSCFGCSSVALRGDLLAVGLSDGSSIGGLNPSGYDQNAAASGAVYLFTRAGVSWSQTGFLKLPHPAANDYFGNAVALDGNLLAVSAPGFAGNTGAVFLFDSTGVAWTDPAMVAAPNPGSTDLFGMRIALLHGMLAVTAPQEDGSGAGINPPFDDNGKDSGAVYVY